MRKIISTTFVTLDGVMQAPGGPEEDTSGGFSHGGWSVNYWDDTMGEKMAGWISRSFDLLLGRKTYDIFAAYWPTSQDATIAVPFNNATKYVASRTLRDLSWRNSQLLEGDVAEAVAALKNGEGPEIQVHGSGNLLQTLIANDLIDEYRVWTFPVLLGTGKRLFAEGTVPAGMRLTDHMVSSTGVSVATYQRTGPVPYGTFAADL